MIKRALLPALAVAWGALGCGGATGPVTRDLTVQMNESRLSLPGSYTIILNPAPARGAAELQASATVSYPTGVSVTVRALVPAPPPPGQLGRVVRVSWLGCDRMEGDLTCVVVNLQSDRRVSAEFTSLEVF